VESANVSAVRLYEKCGFQAGEREELMMAWKEKDGILIPPREVEILVLNRWVILPHGKGEENPL
jgi:ribosomal protein S18 acetylase RimI-like enzyme